MPKPAAHPMMQDDYIGSDYYAWNYPNLVIAHTRGVTASPQRVRYEPGNVVIVAARNEDREVYGFLATVTEVLDNKVSRDFWPTTGDGPNDYPVNKLSVHTPIMRIPANLFSKMTQAGLKLVDRKTVADYLRAEAGTTTPLPFDTQETAPVQKPEVKKDDRIGYLYILRNLLGDGYKIGITDNIHRRFKQLEVGSKAECIGYWSSLNYRNLERFLHNHYTPCRVPQSEWFMLTDHELDWAISWLNDSASVCQVAVVHETWLVRMWRALVNFILGK